VVVKRELSRRQAFTPTKAETVAGPRTVSEQPGEVIGEIGLLTGQRVYLTRVVTAPSRILRIQVEQVQTLMDQESDRPLPHQRHCPRPWASEGLRPMHGLKSVAPAAISTCGHALMRNMRRRFYRVVESVPQRLVPAWTLEPASGVQSESPGRPDAISLAQFGSIALGHPVPSLENRPAGPRDLTRFRRARMLPSSST
jgi:hypothetical protein